MLEFANERNGIFSSSIRKQQLYKMFIAYLSAKIRKTTSNKIRNENNFFYEANNVVIYLWIVLIIPDKFINFQFELNYKV